MFIYYFLSKGSHIEGSTSTSLEECA